jgi:hypothetical protein
MTLSPKIVVLLMLVVELIRALLTYGTPPERQVCISVIYFDRVALSKEIPEKTVPSYRGSFSSTEFVAGIYFWHNPP